MDLTTLAKYKREPPLEVPYETEEGDGVGAIDGNDTKLDDACEGVRGVVSRMQTNRAKHRHDAPARRDK